MSEYNVNSIKVLSDIQHIRMRPGMYIGECNHPGHLFSEIYDNALDELQNGYGTVIKVIVDYNRNEYTVVDDGRGIPIGEKELPNGEKKQVVEVLFTMTNSGGKFDNEAFKIRSGLHGVGSTVVNALSEFIKVKINRDGLEEVFECENEVMTKLEIKEEDPSMHGTRVTFKPDKSIFQSDVIPLHFIVNRCKIASALGMKTELFVDGKEIDISSDIFDLIPVDEDISIYTKTKFRVRDEETGESIVVAMMYTSDTSWWYGGYTNLLHNPSGGTHYRIMDDAVEDAIGSYKIEGVTPKDYYLGIKLVIAAFISDPSFSSQTKEKLTVDKKKLDKFTPMISKEIKKWLDSDPDIRDGIFKRMQDYRAAQNKILNQKDISKLVIKNNNSSGKGIRRRSVVSKLIECTSTDREHTELYLCLHGDTEVKLLDGTVHKMSDLEENYKDKEFWVYGTNKDGQFIPVKASHPRVTKYVNSLVKITLSDGSIVRCTPEHRFLDRDSMKWVTADSLVKGQSLARLTTKVSSKGYEIVYDPVTLGYTHTHTIVNSVVNHDDYVSLNYDPETSSEFLVTRHIDYNKLNNDPSNLKWFLKSDHFRYHASTGAVIGTQIFRKYTLSDKHRKSSSERLTAYNKSEHHKIVMKKAWNDPDLREVMSKGVYCRSEEGIQKQKDAMHNLKYTNPESYHKQVDHLRDPKYREAQLEGLRKARPHIIEISSERFRRMNSDDSMKSKQLRGRVGSIIRSILDEGLEFNEDSYNSHRKKGTITFEGILKIFKSYDEALEYGKNYNHKVVSVGVEFYDEPIPVYCLTVDSDFHSYVLSNGLITHNCEGDSASGSFLPVRNRKTQAILPLRGKILNVSKLDDILTSLKNSEVLDIVNGIGAGLLDESDPALSRYEKIIIASDSDPDGAHIAALLIGLMVNLLPNLVKAGMLYMVEPALYSWRDKQGLHFTNEIKDIPQGCEFTRFKGLGEMDPEEVDICLTNPETRGLIRINYPDNVSLMNSVLTSSSVRKQLLEELGVIKYNS